MIEKPEFITSENILGTKTNIAFIGFMGTGKTTIGMNLAQKTGLKFVDIDLLIKHKK